MKKTIAQAASVAVLLAASFSAGPALAEEVTLRGPTAFALGPTFSPPYEGFVYSIT